MFFKGFKPKKIKQIKSDLVHLASSYYYSLNDATTPDLKISEPLPSMGNLKFSVKGMSTQPRNPNETRSLNCYYNIEKCILNTQKFLSPQIKKWSACNILQVDPVAGSDLNAYYDRSSLKFFYYNFKRKNFYFADSADIVTHELGHALLDAMRPDFWSVQALEIWSFHEAFSDIIALFNIMNYDVVLQKALSQTNGDLSKSNCISRLAEEVGMLLRALTQDSTYLANSLRDPAIEKFKYINPSGLPEDAPNNQLSAECHSFGRVFSSAWYNIVVRIFNFNVSNKMEKFAALKNARDTAFSTLVQAIPASPRVENYYTAIAKCMVSVASSKNANHARIIKDVFKEWNILNDNSLKALSNTSLKSIMANLNKSDIVLKNKLDTLVSIKKNMTLSLSDLPLVSGLSIKEDFKVEVAFDSFFEFNNQGVLSNEITPNEEQIKKSAAQCILSIQDNIGKNKMWSVKNGILTRNFI